MLGNPMCEDTTGVENDIAVRGFENIGAWNLGRKMIGPIRGNWPDDEWKGWWGDNPPYYDLVHVLTSDAHDPITMDGWTTFSFVTDGIESALKQAKDVAGDEDVRRGGGSKAIRQYLLAGLIDKLHIAISPVILGSGEPLFTNINVFELCYTFTEFIASPTATHIVLTKQR